MRKFALILAPLLIAAALSCGVQDDPVVAPPTHTPDEQECSARGMDTQIFTENPDLTGQANETRREIAFLAVECDYDGLAELADDEFSYSFGEDEDPAGYWRAREAEDEPVLRYLVQLLAMDVHVEEAGPGQDPLTGTLYTWPRAFQDGSAQARAEVEEVFGERYAEESFAPEGYIGYRVGIRGDGNWVFFIAGD